MGFGIAMGLLASASWAAANMLIQRAARAAGPFRALVWAQIVGALFVAPFAVVLDRRVAALDGATVAWAAVAGVAAVVGYGALFFSAGRGRLSVVVPVMSSWSVVAAALSLAWLGERPRRPQMVGSALVIAGVLLVSRFSQALGPSSPPPPSPPPSPSPSPSPPSSEVSVALGRERGALAAAVATALGFGVLMPAMERLAPAVGRVGVIPLIFILDLAIGVPIALAARIDLRPPPLPAWPVIAGAGACETAGFVWISLGFSSAPVSVVSPLAGLSSAITVLVAWVALRERPAPLVLAGAALACAGVVVLAL